MKNLKTGDVFLDTFEVREPVFISDLQVVFRLKDLFTDASYILKAFNHPHSVDAELRFRQVMARASRIPSEGIAGIKQFGIEDDYFYIIEEYYEGIPLSQLIKARGGKPFMPEELESIISDLVSTLSAVHEEIPHLLIHPENIIVLPDRVVLTDTGKALAFEHEFIEKLEKEKGRPVHILPPELRSGENLITTSADIYMLGVLLYTLLTGKLPPEPPQEPQFPSEINEDLTVDVDEFVISCIHAGPSVRPASTKDFLEKFYEILGKPAPARGAEKKEYNLTEITTGREQEDIFSILEDITQEETEPPPVTVEKPEEPEVTFERKTSPLIAGVIAGVISALVVAGVFMFLLKRGKGQVEVKVPEKKEVPAQVTAQKPSPAPSPATSPPTQPEKLKEEETPRKKMLAEVPPQKMPKQNVQKEVEKESLGAPSAEKGKKKKKEQKKEIVIPRRKKKKVSRPKKPCPDDMVLIPAGSFTIGTPQDDEMWDPTDLPAKKVHLKAFCIDRYEYPNKKGKIPHVAVTWYEAKEICERQGKRLCSEAEWERACKGPDNYRYPYGNKWKSDFCVTEDARGKDRKLYPSGKAKLCKSRFGVYDMSGNAAEWVADTFEKGLPDKTVKGGSFERPDYAVRCSSRLNYPPDTRDGEIGFRCCKDPVK